MWQIIGEIKWRLSIYECGRERARDERHKIIISFLRLNIPVYLFIYFFQRKYFAICREQMYTSIISQRVIARITEHKRAQLLQAFSFSFSLAPYHNTLSSNKLPCSEQREKQHAHMHVMERERTGSQLVSKIYARAHTLPLILLTNIITWRNVCVYVKENQKEKPHRNYTFLNSLPSTTCVVSITAIKFIWKVPKNLFFFVWKILPYRMFVISLSHSQHDDDNNNYYSLTVYIWWKRRTFFPR